MDNAFTKFCTSLLILTVAVNGHYGIESRYIYLGRMVYGGSDYVVGTAVGLSMRACIDRCVTRQSCEWVEYQYLSKFCKLLSRVNFFIYKPGFYAVTVIQEYKEFVSTKLGGCSNNETLNETTGICEEVGECGFPSHYPSGDVTGNMFNTNNKVMVCQNNEMLIQQCNSTGDWEQIPFQIDQAWEFKLTCGEMKSQSRCLYSGVYPNIYGVNLYCDFDTDGGGWTVIQRRFDGSVDFSRTMQEYEDGFGSLESGGEFWLGLKHLAQILRNSTSEFELRVELKDARNNEGYGIYRRFDISDGSDFYRLSVGSFSGTIGDSLNVINPHWLTQNGQMFSTKDFDNDSSSGENCADKYKAGWWYNACFAANLNGEYLTGKTSGYRGIIWSTWRTYEESLKETSMKIRETSLIRHSP